MPEEAPKKPAKITQVAYGMTVNIGEYETVRFDLTASVAEDEDWREVLESLRRKALALKKRAKNEGS